MLNNRDHYREMFYLAWKKHQAGELLSDLERQLVNVVNEHPEYQNLVENPDFSEDFAMDENPYLHLSLHLSLNEQLNTKRPAEITHIYDVLKNRVGEHEAQHKIMNEMAELIWQAQQNGKFASDAEYLEKLKRLI